MTKQSSFHTGSSSVDSLFAPETKNVHGRKKELQVICEALSDPSGASQVLLFLGAGGIGKTRVLREAGEIAHRNDPQAILCPEIFDLYRSDFHNVEGLQNALVEALDPDCEWFGVCREAARAAVQKEGIPGDVLRERRKAATEAFVEDYRELARQRRVLLRFDTLEVMQHESDAVQVLCELGKEELEVRTWLMTLIPRLPNTVVLAASRPPLAFQCTASDLVLPLDVLDETATIEYVRDLSTKQPLLLQLTEEDITALLYRVSLGKPIRLSLAIHLFLNGLDPSSFPASPKEQELDKQIAEELQSSGPSETRTLVRYMSLARKGLDVELLMVLEPAWNRERCQAALDDMEAFAFVKLHPETSRLFLHDELARLYNFYGLEEWPDETLAGITDYYAHKIENAQGHEERLALEVERLYYELRRDGGIGFTHYQELDDRAIEAGNLSYDMALRNELLRFVNDPTLPDTAKSGVPDEDERNRDAALRWVQRYIASGQYVQAAKVGHRLVDENHTWFADGDSLYRGAIQVAYAQALIYGGASEEQTTPLLTGAIDQLAGWQPEDGWQEEDPRKTRRDLILGRAHNFLGYSHRLHGRYQAAQREYKQAIWLFRGSGIHGDLAAALTNLGFLYGLKGQITRAEALFEDAISLHTQLGLEYLLGLSENALGLSHTYGGRPISGVAWCRKALNRFKKLAIPRGTGLAHLALGFALRRQANLWKRKTYTFDEAEELFKSSEVELLAAKEIFQDEAPEPSRLAETCDESGSLYLDQAWLLQARRDEARRGGEAARYHELQARAEALYQQAAEILQQGIDVATKQNLTLQTMDMLDDLSQVCYDRARLYEEQNADRREYYTKLGDFHLDLIVDAVPAEYRLSDRGFEKIGDPQEDWWLTLGKVELGKGVRQLREAVSREESDKKDTGVFEAVTHYAAAVAYFQKYSPDSPRLQDTLASVHRHLKTLSRERLILARDAILAYQASHCVELDSLVELLRDALGLEPDF